MPETSEAKKELARVVNGVLKEFNFAVGDGIAVIGEGDAVYGKFKALCDRAAARDFLDVRAIAQKDGLDFYEGLFYARAAYPDMDEDGFKGVLSQVEDMEFEEFDEYLADVSELEELKAFFKYWGNL